MRVHLLVNYHRPDALRAAAEATDELKKRGAEVAADVETARRLNLPPAPDLAFADADLVITFGGDGTLIRAANLCSEKGTPILGVYYGRFGFVTQCQSPDLKLCLDAVFDKTAYIDERMMLKTDLLRNGKPISTLHCLNETVLQREVTSRMMIFEVKVDGKPLTRYPADGVLVATATGSTGYNLSSGGPILHPGVQALILTAISPHTLSARPLVLRGESVVEFSVRTVGDAVLSTDGYVRLHLLSGDVVRVSRSPRVTKLVSLGNDDFLVKLSERLLWSHRIIEDQE
ncbi:MAG: kinase [Fimbriimonadaceae bacterium]|nr:kinase [Fimbriimonadaceae bacterium]